MGIAMLIPLAILVFIIPVIMGYIKGNKQQTNNTGGSTIPGLATTTTLKRRGATIKIPATKGKTCNEQYLPNLAFSCSPQDVMWYITMRWPYAAWAWSGNSRVAENTFAAYEGARVAAYNPKTKKIVITAICESGPAPWAGSSWAANHPPVDTDPTAPYWPGYLQFDPPQADGRVSGLAPMPIGTIGANCDDELIYGFPVDQSIPVGPYNGGNPVN